MSARPRYKLEPVRNRVQEMLDKLRTQMEAEIAVLERCEKLAVQRNDWDDYYEVVGRLENLRLSLNVLNGEGGG